MTPDPPENTTLGARAPGDPCPHCGSEPKYLLLPFGAKTLIVGGAELCRCQAVAKMERALQEAEQRQRQQQIDTFWEVSQFGAEFRTARLDKPGPTGWKPFQQPALAAGRRVLEQGGGLLLTGPSGTGKTLICCALLNEAATRGEFAIPATLPHLLDQMRASWDRGESGPSEGWLTDRIKTAPWVLLDDLGEVGRWAQDKVFALANARWMRRDRLVTLATSNLPMTGKPGVKALSDVLGDRVISRLVDMCTVVKVEGPDQRVARAKGRRDDG